MLAKFLATLSTMEKLLIYFLSIKKHLKAWNWEIIQENSYGLTHFCLYIIYYIFLEKLEHFWIYLYKNLLVVVVVVVVVVVAVLAILAIVSEK